MGIAVRDEKWNRKNVDVKKHRNLNSLNWKKRELERQLDRDKLEDERRNSAATKEKLFGDAKRGSAIRMGADPIDTIPVIRNVKQLFTVYEVPTSLQAMLICAFLSDKTKTIVGKLSPEVLGDYDSLTAALLREFKVSANV